MENQPFVAVFVVTYNQELFLDEAINSILGQKTTFRVKIFIGEDFSTDSTREICLKLKEKNPSEIELILQNKNVGVKQNTIDVFRACFNTGAKYIAMLEGDDFWKDPYKLQKQVAFLESNSEINLCCTRAEVLKNDKKLQILEQPETGTKGIFQFSDLLKHYNFIATASVMFRNPISFEFPEWFKKIPFGDLCLYKLFTMNGKFKVLDDISVVYRVHGNGIYSKLSTIDKQTSYLLFYKYIYAILNIEEQNIVITKRKKVLNILAKERFPNARWLCKWERWRLNQKYPINA